MVDFAKQFDSKEIDQAGRVLANVPSEGEDDREWVEAFELVGRWRGCTCGTVEDVSQ